ncbi:MAG TPA: penicillin acylase family protein, partial [Kofleriaceae bacterium]|nr:penicillin acylase family protein [Kofleriaceae bacterium]
MLDLPRPRLAGHGLACFLSLGLLAAACGDDLPPSGDEGDDTGNTEPVGITIEGMDGPVDVTFDESGIMHAGCSSDADCFAVEGYFHAAHRFGQMDIRRRVGRGRLAALAGAITLDTSDKPQRAMMTSRDGTPLEEQLLAAADDRTLAALEAYSRGVNAWLADLASGENGAELPDEYSFPIINQDAVQDDWEPVDSVACILPLVDELTDFASIDIALGDIYAALDPDVAADLFSLRPPSTSTVLPPTDGLAPAAAARAARARSSADADARRRIHERMVAARPLLAKALAKRGEVKIDHSSRGSNNWIVGPSQAAGSTLLANDPHLGMSHPAIWYLVNLDAKTGGSGDIHVAGASFAGLPGIVLGQNENIAWGATTTYFDSTDVYMETLNDARDAVLFNGEEVPLENIDYTFEVAGAEPVTSTFQYVPHHGPIIAVDEDAGTALSVRWTGHDANTDINFFLGLATAASVDDARVALEQVTTAGQNFVVIDRWGSIGWFPYMRLPTRPWLATRPDLPPFLPL